MWLPCRAQLSLQHEARRQYLLSAPTLCLEVLVKETLMPHAKSSRVQQCNALTWLLELCSCSIRTEVLVIPLRERCLLSNIY